MTPENMLEKTTTYLKNLQKAEALVVAVGLPHEKLSGRVYSEVSKRQTGDRGEPTTVIEVGAGHEFGLGNLPKRSFLREPFKIKKSKLKSQITAQFKAVAEKGRGAEKALNIIGVEARNISIEAFKTGGFGTWQPDSAQTIKQKESDKILINTGTLRNSVTWIVRRR